MAHVHVVIIGLTRQDREPPEKRLFSYSDIKGDPTESRHIALTPYLFDAGTVVNRHLVVEEAGRTLCHVPQLLTGCQPIDDGQYIFNAAERVEFLSQEPNAKKYFRPFMGSVEFINGAERWILILDGESPGELRSMPAVMKRMAAVRKFRFQSRRTSTLHLAEPPTRFQVTVIPTAPFLVIPEVSSERRAFVPIGWLDKTAPP